MIFWTLLLASSFIMIFMYFQWGHIKPWLLILVFGLLAVSASILIYILFPNIYTNDLIALFIPYLFLIPLHYGSRYIIKNYVLVDDNKTSKFLVAIYNRLLNLIWLVNGFFLFGFILALLDSLFDRFKDENIWTLVVTGFMFILLSVGSIVLSYKKKFCYVVVVGENKTVYKLESTKSRIKVRTVLNTDEVYPRGIIRDKGISNYLFYIKDEINMKNTKFKKSSSEMFEYIKQGIETHELIEQKQLEYIEKNSGVNHNK